MDDGTAKWQGSTLLAGMFLGAAIFVVLNGWPDWPITTRDLDPSSTLGSDADRSMALSSWAMVAISAFSLGIGLYSVWLLRENLKEARAVTREARESTKAAQESVVAALSATERTWQLGLRQSRAYIVTNETVLTLEHDTATVKVTFRNAGLTPTTDLRCTIRLGIFKNSGGITWISQRVAWPNQLAAGEPSSVSAIFTLRLNDYADECLTLGYFDMVVETSFEFSDVFGESQSASERRSRRASPFMADGVQVLTMQPLTRV